MKVYTKTGDKGLTSLIGGERVSKTDLRVEAYGTVDELSAFTALLGDRMRGEEQLCDLVPRLEEINCRLMSVAALLAVGRGGEGKLSPLSEEAVTALEEQIDEMQSRVPAITKFTIPGGHVLLSLCHVCRTVCRRAERSALRASVGHEIDPTALRYLNRLSDWFYLLGRLVTERLKIEETLWRP